MDGFMILGIVLLAAGFLFVGIETLIPGFGAPGILGGCCLVAGVFLIADSVQEAVIIVAVVLLLLAVLIFTLVTLLAKGRLKTPIILNDKMNKEVSCRKKRSCNHGFTSGRESTDRRCRV